MRRWTPKPLPIARKPLLILLVLLPGDVRWQPILPAYLPLARRQKRRPSSPGSTWFLPSRIDLPPSIYVRTGIDRIPQNTDYHATVRAVADKFSQCRKDSLSDSELDSFFVQRSQHAMDGADARKLLKNQSDYRLHLLIWIQHHLTRW